jgi:hypothetical protein
MSRPLVSVITPTWQRHDLLMEAIENVRQQDYRPLEHVIVSDGPDRELKALVARTTTGGVKGWESGPDPRPPITFVELGRNWSSYLPDSFCAAPNVVAQLLARGELQMFLADDERMEPDHISSLVDLLEETGADFAYSKVRLYRVGETPEQGWTIGSPSPSLGQITNCLYRTELLKRGLYPFRAGMTSDWACISQWMDKGATWAFLDRCTLTHRVDH